MKKSLLLLAAGLMVGAFITGCGTDDPWVVEPDTDIVLSIVSGPSGTVANGSSVAFSWSSRGGVGEVTYRYQLASQGWSEWSNSTHVTFSDVAGPASYAFVIEARGETSGSASITRNFDVTDTSPATTIVESPIEGSFVATGSTIPFTWESEDPGGYGENIEFSYSTNFQAGGPDTSNWIPTRTVTFVDVEAADPALFILWSRNPAGTFATDTVSFVTKDATILYVDDYQWLNLAGNADMPKERDQKQFWRDVLEGYAFAEWDIELQGMPDSAYVLNFSTIVWASDSYLGDAAGTWWYQIGGPGESSIHYFMENEGNIVAAGANILQWMYNTNPPAPGDFEYEWFGINDVDGWDYWADFTWAVSAGNYAALPDSMKIDVGKNGDQTDYAEDIFGFRDSTVILYTKGLDIDGEEPWDYEESVGHIFYPGGGAARGAMLNFDAYSMPLAGIRATYQTILTEFGE